jgi:hypothetical protein
VLILIWQIILFLVFKYTRTSCIVDKSFYLIFNNYFKNTGFRIELYKIISYVIDFRSYVFTSTIVYKRENTVQQTQLYYYKNNQPLFYGNAKCFVLNT